jgi:predicted permease
LFTIFQQILSLFIIIGIGWVITHVKIANESWSKTISSFALYIGFPALIFSGIAKAPIDTQLITKSFGVNSIIILSIIGVLLLVFKAFKFTSKNKATYLICFMFGNVAFLGIPLISSINPDLQQEATLNAAVHLFWVFSIGIFFVEYYNAKEISSGKIILNLFKNPLLLAVLFGLGFNILNISLPPLLLKPIEMLGSSVSPIVMLMIGIFIKTHPIKSKNQIVAPLTYSAFKLIIIPIVCILIISTQSNTTNYLATITDIAMPIAITPFALADHYNLDKEFISNSIIISTLSSIITLPFIIELIT